MPKRLPNEIIEKIHKFRDAGLSKKVVERLLNIDYSTVRLYWMYAPLAQSVEAKDFCRASFIEDVRQNPSSVGSNLTGGTKVLQAYVFLLGCYFGDGYINKQGKYTYKIRFALDTKYPQTINEVLTNLQLVYNSGFVTKVTNSKSVSVAAHSYMIPSHFPHLGIGAKHNRNIELQPWQKLLVDTYPWDFIKGLYYTDGSRYIQNQKGRQYPKYNFTNRSRDIINLFAYACDTVNVNYYINERPFYDSSGNKNIGWTLTVGRREDVAILDSQLGAKQ